MLIVEEIQGLPSDWESYYWNGCDVDGGNYCPTWLLVTNEDGKYFMIRASTRRYFPNEQGKYLVVREGVPTVIEESALREGEDAILLPADAEEPTPITLEEWEKLKEEIKDEFIEYDMWVKERF